MNNLAFMSLGVGDEEAYRVLSDRALELRRGPLTLLTRTLWSVLQDAQEEAKRLLAEAATVLAEAPPEGVHEEVSMFSPAALARADARLKLSKPATPIPEREKQRARQDSNL